MSMELTVGKHRSFGSVTRTQTRMSLAVGDWREKNDVPRSLLTNTIGERYFDLDLDNVIFLIIRSHDLNQNITQHKNIVGTC